MIDTTRLSEAVGVDLGTSNLLVHVKGRGIVVREPCVVGVSDGDIVALGEDARAMLGRTPHTIRVVQPVRDGVIADYSIASKMLGYLLRRVSTRRRLLKPNVCICVPSGATAVEKRALVEAALAAGARRALPVEEPLAAALGAGLEVTSPSGHLVVDIGGGTTDIAVISLGGIVLSESARIGGSELDAMVVRQVRRGHNMVIGERTAEEIKTAIGSAYPLPNESTMSVKGRDVVSGLPKTAEIGSEEIREALAETVATLVERVRDVLERTPPELAADIIEHGIILTGGGALLRGLDRLIESQTEVHVRVAEDPLTCVAVGTGMYLELARTLPAGLLATGDEASSGYIR
ncbi:MAG: rod shape-determining protein [Armatimonadetes bacterium]|nr:rod shape-determining protein [Armatimonadota bacterium]